MKKFTFKFIEHSRWPELSWIACWPNGASEITVHHGRRVEIGNDWFGEVIWDANFEDVGFDRSDIVFGSAAKIVADGVLFVPSSSTLDRIVSANINGQWLVSNSLVCLAAVADLNFSPWYPNYPRDFGSIIKGLDKYQKTIDSSGGRITMTYFDNLRFNGQSLKRESKPFILRNRSTFDQYQTFLAESVERCVSNSKSEHRVHPWDLLGTISTGFDSPTVAALGKRSGLTEAITITSSRGGKSDCGTAIGKCLGLNVYEVDRNAWSENPLSETIFLSADAKGEDVYFSGAMPMLNGKLLMTGYTGSIWGGRSEDYCHFIRTDQSGLSLTEFRLQAGFINWPVATMGIWKAYDVLQIMNSDEARKWANGQAYDKPFCRKVLTEANVPTKMYGNEKKAASVLIEDRSSFLSNASKADFESYIEELFSRPKWAARKHQIERTASRLLRSFVRINQVIAGTTAQATGSRLLSRIKQSTKLSEFAAGEPNFRFLFPWAIEHSKKLYSQ